MNCPRPPSMLKITVGEFVFAARFEEAAAPKTCARFRRLLPLRSSLIHARWSGEACWIPRGYIPVELPFENHTSSPAPGQLLWYPGGISETEMLLPYGSTNFANNRGRLAGNHFLTIVSGIEHLPKLGWLTLWKGAQEITFELSA